jgi:hypothetical protein
LAIPIDFLEGSGNAYKVNEKVVMGEGCEYNKVSFF